MTKIDPIIAVKDVNESAEWYQEVFDCKRTYGGNEFAVLEHLLDPIDFFFGIPAIIAIQSTERNQRLGDLWAGTTIKEIPEWER